MNLKFLATKASSYIGITISYLGVILATAAQFAPFVLPALSPKAQTLVGVTLAAAGHLQTFLSASVLPQVNTIASAESFTGSVAPLAPTSVEVKPL
jgi:hypothetical protein